MTRSDVLVNMTLRLYYKGQASALDTRKSLIRMYEDNKITLADYQRAIAIIG